MTQYTKPTVLPAWAESAGGADVLQPSNAEIQAGWPLSNVPPSRKRFNWVLKYLAQGVRYILQRGMPEWDAAEDYRINDRVMASDGKTYKCIQAGINKDPTTQTTYWVRWGFTLAEYDAEGTTPAQFDNSVKRASTAFVQQNGVRHAGLNQYSASATLTAANDAGKVIVCGGGTPYTLTLPLANSCPAGTTLTFFVQGTTVTFTKQGTNAIGIGPNSSLTSFNMGSGDFCTLVNYNGTDTWAVVSGTPLLQNAALSGVFGANKVASNGYQKLSSGMILQWATGGTGQTSEGGQTVNFPIAFPNACLFCTVGVLGTGLASDGWYYYSSSTTSSASVMANSTTSSWGSAIYPLVLALGY